MFIQVIVFVLHTIVLKDVHAILNKIITSVDLCNVIFVIVAKQRLLFNAENSDKSRGMLFYSIALSYQPAMQERLLTPP